MRAFAPALGILLFCNWIASVVGFRWAMEVFADFVMEMPPLTLLAIWATQGFPLLLGAAFVGFASFSMVRRERTGWCFGFVVCLMCDLLFLGYANLANDFIDNLGNGQRVSLLSKVEGVISLLSSVKLSAISENYERGALILAASFVLTQVILGALIFGSRGLVAPRSERREVV